MKVSRTRKLTLTAVLISLALVLHVLERMLPVPQVAMGVKLGLANIVTLIAIYSLSFGETVFIVVVRTLLASLLGGGFTSFWFSVTGGLFSLVTMYVLAHRFSGLFSLPAISVVGAITHNLGQLLVASLVVDTASIFYYLPVLAISAAITGALIGISSRLILLFLLRRGLVQHQDALQKACDILHQ